MTNSMTDSSNRIITEKVSRFSHHAFFYYLLTHSDIIRLFFCQLMSDHLISYTSVDNPFFSSDIADKKSNIMDVVAIDDLGEVYNIEMQNYPINESQITRFLIYGGVLLRHQTSKGIHGYHQVKVVHQLIINNTYDIKGLHHIHYNFVSYDPIHHIKQPYNKNDLHLLQLEHIDEIKEKNKELYELLYLFKNDKPCDTMKTSKLVKEVITMHDAYMDSKAFWNAFYLEQEELQKRTLLYEAKNDGIELGELRGEKRGIRVAYIDILTEYGINKFQENIKEWLKSLNEEELRIVRTHIFQVETLEELKKKIR